MLRYGEKMSAGWNNGNVILKEDRKSILHRRKNVMERF